MLRDDQELHIGPELIVEAARQVERPSGYSVLRRRVRIRGRDVLENHGGAFQKREGRPWKYYGSAANADHPDVLEALAVLNGEAD